MKKLLIGLLALGSFSSFAEENVCGKIQGLFSRYNQELAIDLQTDNGETNRYTSGNYNSGAGAAIASAAYLQNARVCLTSVGRKSDSSKVYTYFTITLGDIKL
ncbi:MAG: hypothetical protein ACOYL6_19265 [Bacteriovoracaceae bacterium]